MSKTQTRSKDEATTLEGKEYLNWGDEGNIARIVCRRASLFSLQNNNKTIRTSGRSVEAPPKRSADLIDSTYTEISGRVLQIKKCVHIHTCGQDANAFLRIDVQKEER